MSTEDQIGDAPAELTPDQMAAAAAAVEKARAEAEAQAQAQREAEAEEQAARMRAAMRAQEEARAQAAADAAAAEAERRAQEEAEAAEVRAMIDSMTMASIQDRAEAENAEFDAMAAAIAALASAGPDQPPIVAPLVPPPDEVPAPRGRFGPYFQSELAAAHVHDKAFVIFPDRILFAPDIPAADRAAVMAVVEAHDPDAPPKVSLAAYAKEARDAHENGGITVQGVPVATDDRSKTLVLGARARAEADPNLVTSWAAADGHVYPLPSALIIAVSDAIGAFVAELFEEYARILSAIAAGDITTTDAIDERYGALNVAF